MLNDYLKTFFYTIFVLPIVLFLSFIFKGRVKKYDSFINYTTNDINSLKLTSKKSYILKVNIDDLQNTTNNLKDLLETKSSDIEGIKLYYNKQNLDDNLEKKLFELFRLKGLRLKFVKVEGVEGLKNITALLDFHSFVQSLVIEKFKNVEVLSPSIQTFNPILNLRIFYNKYFSRYYLGHKTFKVNLSIAPEKRIFNIYNFQNILNFFYTLSFLSAKTTDKKFNISLDFENINYNNLDNFLRYILVAYSSKKVNKIYINSKVLTNSRYKDALENLVTYIDGSEIIDSKILGDLYVITMQKGSSKYDITWVSTNREIELTDFNKVFDKFNKALKNDVKITSSPIFALH